MQNHKKFQIIVSFVLPLLIICVFASTALGVSVLGASVFKTMQGETEASTQCSVAVGYMRTKLMNAQNAGNVYVEVKGGIEVLCISTFLGDIEYETRIFLHEGTLKESFVQKSTPFSTTAMQEIAKIQKCEFMLRQSGMCIVTVTSTQNDIMRVAVQLAPEV